MEFTFTITNEMNIPIQGLVFRDILSDPCTWAFEPYGESGLSIANPNVNVNEAIFTIDEVQANTVATFHMDASLNSWESDGTLSNTATLENVPDVINEGYITLTSNSTTTEITASPKIDLQDTILVENLTDKVNLEAILSTFADITWTTEGDGIFTDQSSESTMYIFGIQDKLNKQVSLFISAVSDCNETGKSVLILIESTNSTSISEYSNAKIYPNPFKNTFVVESSNVFDSYEILDFNGKVITERKSMEPYSKLEIDMKSYSAGVYLLKLITDKKIQYAKVVKI